MLILARASPSWPWSGCASASAPAGHLLPSWSWFNPFNGPSFSKVVTGLLLMLFIYWGWDTSVSINEETSGPDPQPGLAAIISTVLLLVTYFVVTLAAQTFAGVGTKGIGLANPSNSERRVLGARARRCSATRGSARSFAHLLILMVLTSAAASTQTTILPTARTTLSMAVYKAIPDAFGRMHKRYLTPTVSTVAMGAVSVVLYIAFNHVAGGNLIPDAVTAIGVLDRLLLRAHRVHVRLVLPQGASPAAGGTCG